MSLYFAYGSNLDRRDVARWARQRGLACDLRPTGRIGWLPDRVLRFDYRSPVRKGGCLDVPRWPGQLAAGALLKVDDDALSALDAKEGAPHRYRRIQAIALTADGPTPVVTYEATDACRLPFAQPAEGYLDVVERGRRDHGIVDEGQLAAAAADRPPPPAVAGVFVYGTLRPGAHQAWRLEQHGVATMQPAWVRGRLLDLGAYPGLVAGTERVHGALVQLTDLAAALPGLDDYEGFVGFGAADNLFARTLVEVHTGPTTRRAWAWMLAEQRDAPTIPGGDWLRR